MSTVGGGRPQRKSHHPFFACPEGPLVWVEQFLNSDRHAGGQAQIIGGGQEATEIFPVQTHNQVHVHRHARNAVQVHGEPAHEQVSDIMRVESAKQFQIEHARPIPAGRFAAIIPPGWGRMSIESHDRGRRFNVPPVRCGSIRLR